MCGRISKLTPQQRTTRDARKAARAQRRLRRKLGTGVPLCGARRKYDGKPCIMKALPSGRCKFHGGMSTGPRTPEGKAKALSCLKQYQKA
jgi:hypothetical protein